jgi:hypothetical protein
MGRKRDKEIASLFLLGASSLGLLHIKACLDSLEG